MPRGRGRERRVQAHLGIRLVERRLGLLERLALIHYLARLRDPLPQLVGARVGLGHGRRDRRGRGRKGFAGGSERRAPPRPRLLRAATRPGAASGRCYSVRRLPPRPAPAVPERAPAGGAASDRGKEERERERLRDPAHARPGVAEERQSEIVTRTRELIEKGGGAWESPATPWGRRRLAYEIDHKAEGVYHLLTFNAEPETLDEISRVLKITDGVMRHMATPRPRAAPPPAPAAAAASSAAAPTVPVEELDGRRDRGRRGVHGQHQPRRPRRQPDPRPRAPAHAERHRRLQACASPSTPAGRTRSGQWVDKPNYFDITVWGNQGESCAQYLAKGRPVGVDGRLDWREWEAQDGTKRQAVEIIADTVQFLGGRGDGERRRRHQFVPAGAARRPTPTSPAAADDDIPF